MERILHTVGSAPLLGGRQGLRKPRQVQRQLCGLFCSGRACLVGNQTGQIPTATSRPSGLTSPLPQGDWRRAFW